MGKKGSWLSAVKRVLSPESKGKKDKKPRHLKKRWFGKQKSLDVDFPTALVIPDHPPPAEEATLTEVETETETEQSKHAYSVAVATAVAAEAAAVAAQAAAEVVRLTSASLYSGKFKEEIAATQIQIAFRGYLARRALHALRGLARLKSLIQGQSVQRQANNTLKCMQTLARVQSQIHTRRLRMSEENQALQRQLLQKHEMEAEKLRASNGENWNDSAQSKEEVEAKLQHKQEAAMRRERALAYAHSHQKTWRNSSKPANQTFMDSNNPHWGWGWLERWMAARPWESRSTTTDGELNSDLAPLKITRSRAISDNKLSPAAQKPSRSPHCQSPSTPPSKAQSPTFGKMSPRGNACGTEDDSRSLRSVQPELYRRHSIASSTVGDEEGLASSSPAVVLSYMASTKSAKSRTQLPSPLGMISNGTPEKPSSAKKRLSFSSSSVGPRRHCSPPRVDTSSAKDIALEI